MTKASSPITTVKRGRRVIATIHVGSSGDQAYLVRRKITHLNRQKERSISDAVRKGIATWSIDEDTLIQVRAKGIRFVGVYCTDTGDIWLTATDRYFGSKASIGWRSTRQLPISQFQRRAGKARL